MATGMQKQTCSSPTSEDKQQVISSCTCRNDLENRSLATRAVVSWLLSEPDVSA